jgi:hypothetical protein
MVMAARDGELAFVASCERDFFEGIGVGIAAEVAVVTTGGLVAVISPLSVLSRGALLSIVRIWVVWCCFLADMCYQTK